MRNVLLADIGNTHFHIYNGKEVEHLSYDEAMSKYEASKMQYISVKSELDDAIEKINEWTNVSEQIILKGAYETMGVDRRALCLSKSEGIFIDAGSAITVDIVENEQHSGGFILPGLKAYTAAYKGISPALDVALNKAISLTDLPCTTKDGISYGIIASIKALIDKHRGIKTLYFTGGDGKFLSTFFKDSIYDETLVFQGMQKALK